MLRHFTIRLLIAIFSMGMVYTATCAEPGAVSTSQDTSLTTPPPGHKVYVYYLYFNPRCDMCINMELYSREAVETGFADAVKTGAVEWRAYNMDSTEHAHFWNDFQLETKSLVMVDEQNGRQARWKNCEKIWDLVESKPDFIKYVQDEVRAYLSENESSTAR